MLIECPDYSGPLLADELKKSCNEVNYTKLDHIDIITFN